MADFEYEPTEAIRTRESGHGKQLCPCQCHPDLSWLSHLGGSLCAPMDVDCLFVVERRNAFLFMEWKWGAEETPLGQRLTLEALSRVRGFTVIVVRGQKPDTPLGYRRIVNGKDEEPQVTSREDLRRSVENWFATGTWQ